MGRQNMLKLAKRIEFEQQNNLCCERSPDNLWSLNEVEVIRQQACQKGSLLAQFGPSVLVAIRVGTNAMTKHEAEIG